MRLGIQLLLTLCTVCLAVWIQMPWPGVVAFGLVGVLAAMVHRPGRWLQYGPRLGWGCLLLLLLCGPLTATSHWFLDPYYVLLLWLNGIAMFVASDRAGEPSAANHWKNLGMAWLLFGGLQWLLVAYMLNLWGGFYLGLGINTVLLLILKVRFTMRPALILAVNTWLLLLLGLPVANWLASHSTDMAAVGANPESKPWLEKRAPALPCPPGFATNRAFTFDAAKRDPAGYQTWRRFVEQQWRGVMKACFGWTAPQGTRSLPLKPNSQVSFCLSQISINSDGFRGPEIAKPKGDVFRIVALGESTTFGTTLTPEHKPWPECLAQIIRDRLKPPRPVEVINAGVPSFSLEDNLARLEADILPLHPDMIISYHGLNGFGMLQTSLPDLKNSPDYIERPLKVLADCEFRVRRWWFKRGQSTKLDRTSPSFVNPFSTKYARAYRQLIHIAHNNGICLVLGTYSMAVNALSQQEVIAFYGQQHPHLDWQIRANATHTVLLRQLAQRYPEVCLVDTQPGLDGARDQFIDVVHLSREGDWQLAETFFSGTSNLLQQALRPASKDTLP
jgi:hypothetical protein